jgi:NADPH:quinone reductase-like Zn-dependent oxidoreductase
MENRINFGTSSGGNQGQETSVPHALILTAFGAKPPALSVEEIGLSEPGADEVLVRMLAAPINPADLNVIEGTYGELPSLPCTIGNEGVGVVERVGSSVVGFASGQTVLPLAFGTWAEQMLVPAEALVALPEGLDPLQAAMLTVNPATAWRMLHDFVPLQPGDWIVDLRTEASALCGGVLPKLALNAVGGASALNVANALGAGSPHVTYGAMGRQPLKIPNSLLIFKNISFRGFWLRRWKETASLTEVRSTYETLAAYLAAGILYTPVHRVFPIEEALEAISEASQEKRSGKVLLRMF